MTTHADAPHHAKDNTAAPSVTVITVSDTRVAANDKSGALLRDSLTAAGFTVAPGVIVHDEQDLIRAAILHALDGGARAVILTGGTGLAPRDVTPEALLREFVDLESWRIMAVRIQQDSRETILKCRA